MWNVHKTYYFNGEEVKECFRVLTNGKKSTLFIILKRDEIWLKNLAGKWKL
jgi:hypothetical protein